MDLIDKAIYIDHGVVREIYTGDEFRNLNENERIRLGLRCFALRRNIKKIETAICKSDVLRVEGLSVAYRKNILFEGVSFTAQKGDIIAVTGENGSGKTAFLRVLCGLMKESSGKIVYNGIAYSYKKRRELCYMTMQDVVHQLFADSVWEEFALLNHAVSDSEIMHILQ